MRRTPSELLKLVKAAAVERGGKCTTRKIRRSTDSVKLVCAKGHTWQAKPHDIIGKRKTWCRRCSYEERFRAYRADIKTIRAYAREQGGKCLSRSYTNAHEQLEFECSHGHQWKATWSNISQGRWCPICRRREAAEARRLGIDAAHAIARERRGKCLSRKYTDNRTPLKWQCYKGHEWDAGLDSVKSGAWCPECARQELSRSRKGKAPPLRRTIDLSDLKAFARSYRGRVLTDFYVNQRQIIDWQCKRGHRFRASFVNIQNREKFCSTCGEEDRKRDCLRRARQLARSKGGRCLSDQYKSARSPMKWQCRKGHKFTESWFNVSNRDRFCMRCD